MVYEEELVLPGLPAWAGGHVEDPQPSHSSSGQQQILLRAPSYADSDKGPLDSLAQAEFTYMHRGRVGSPIQLLYDGPFKILDKRPKTFLHFCWRWVIGKSQSLLTDIEAPHWS
jgi:hypothetical protein